MSQPSVVVDVADPVAFAWLPIRPPAGRDVVLVVADEPLRGALVELARAKGFGAYACRTPLDVIDTLLELGDSIACAILSSVARWSTGLHEFLTDEYPGIPCVAIDA